MKLDLSRVFSEIEIEELHTATLKILEQTGAVVQNQELLRHLRAAGADVDGEKSIVHFPRELVEQSIQSAPAMILLHSRNEKEAIEIGHGVTQAVSGFDGTFFVEYESGERLPITKEQVGTFAFLADQLPEITIVAVQGLPQDVPQELAEAHAVSAMLQNTGKHLLTAPDTGKVAELVYQILALVVGNEDIGHEPVISCQVSPSSPLRWTPEACKIILSTVKRGIPFYILPSPMAGATSPVTLAGHLALHNAEILSGLVISQVLREGHPVVYGNAPTLFNLREGNPVIGTPETILLRIAGAQMARFYRVPSHSIGFDTDAHILDQQCSWEKSLTAQACVQAGIDVMVNLGMFSTGLSVSYESLLIDHEVFSLLKRYSRGIEVTQEHLAVEVIDKIGSWGSFLQDEHTLHHFKNENWYPELSCRMLFEPWTNAGSREVHQVAHERVQELLQKKRKRYLDGETVFRIERLLVTS